METFEYVPLDRSTRSIRLLSFEEEDETTGPRLIRCRLETFDLDACPPFIALSYTWGEPGTCHEISLNERALVVRENLHSALSELSNNTLASLARLRADVYGILRRLKQGKGTSFVSELSQLKALVPEDRWHWTLSALARFYDSKTGVWKESNIGTVHSAVFSSIMNHNHDDIILDCPRIRLALRRPRYWIDALCINQHDDRERGHQVNMMSTIYSQAIYVFAWLGSAPEEPGLVTKMVEIFRNPSSPRQEALDELSELPYWGRMWIVQEFTLAQNIIMLYGKHRLQWRSLEHSLRLGMGRVLLRKKMRGPMGWIAHIRRSRWPSDVQNQIAYVNTETLDKLITKLGTGGCSDVKDRIYALLSMTSTQRRSSKYKPLYPDYTISCCQLYYRVVGNVRYLPSLSDKTDWEKFRKTLRRTLEMIPDEVFRRNELLYQVTEHERRQPQPLLLQCHTERVRLGQVLLKELADYFQKSFDDISKGSQQRYKEIIGLFHDFPKLDDPEAWNCFDNLLKEALGL